MRELESPTKKQSPFGILLMATRISTWRASSQSLGHLMTYSLTLQGHLVMGPAILGHQALAAG